MSKKHVFGRLGIVLLSFLPNLLSYFTIGVMFYYQRVFYLSIHITFCILFAIFYCLKWPNFSIRKSLIIGMAVGYIIGLATYIIVAIDDGGILNFFRNIVELNGAIILLFALLTLPWMNTLIVTVGCYLLRKRSSPAE